MKTPPDQAPPKFRDGVCHHCGNKYQVLSGHWLRWHRERQELSLRHLARLSGLSAAYLSDVERDNRHVTTRVEKLYQRLVLS